MRVAPEWVTAGGGEVDDADADATLKASSQASWLESLHVQDLYVRVARHARLKAAGP